MALRVSLLVDVPWFQQERQEKAAAVKLRGNRSNGFYHALSNEDISQTMPAHLALIVVVRTKTLSSNLQLQIFQDYEHGIGTS
jgi:hypothetical protein